MCNSVAANGRTGNEFLHDFPPLSGRGQELLELVLVKFPVVFLLEISVPADFFSGSLSAYDFVLNSWKHSQMSKTQADTLKNWSLIFRTTWI